MGLSQLIVTIIAAALSGVVPLAPTSGTQITAPLRSERPIAAQSAVSTASPTSQNTTQQNTAPAVSSSTSASAEKTFSTAPQKLTQNNAQDLNPLKSGVRVQPLVNHGSSVSPQSTVQNTASLPPLSKQTLDSTISYSQPATKEELRAFDEDRDTDTGTATQTANQSRPSVANRSLGVDVSVYQGTDMSGYARAGATFAIVKISEGTGYKNPHAAGQISSALRNRMQVNGYFFATFGSNIGAARAQANYAANSANAMGLPRGSYFAVDWETGDGNFINGPRTANTNAVIAAMQVLRSRGYLPLCYSGAYVLRRNLDVNSIVRAFPGSIWAAAYATTGRINYPDFDYFPSMPGVAIWQFSDSWKGMNVDGNINVLPLNAGGSAPRPAPKPRPKPAPKPKPKPSPKPKPKPKPKPDPKPDPNPALKGCPANPFADAQSGWYATAIRYVNCKHVMTGYNSRSFGPNNELLRSEAVTLLWRRAGKPRSKTRTHYVDQAQIPSYAKDAVNWAYEKNIMRGYGNLNTFGPNTHLTREQAAKVIAVASGAKVGKPSARDLGNYRKLLNSGNTDKGMINYMVWANAHKVITGWKTPAGANADPTGGVTRAQMAQIMMNAMENRIFKK